ncbi:MAG: glutamyl-tRNA reductase [Blastocatellia bacterium]|jgi:glutamyl-tRNA reductase|nr:glutamyl-tRNA reductase [Blastocatellia bacterium]
MPVVLNGLEWQTCLRRILFLNRIENSALIEAAENDELVSSGVDVYRGRDAYGFLLEVICGLNSPLLGETAVMGQFREFCAHSKFSNTAWGSFLRQLTANVLVDAKRVRHEHLQGIGSQSYGSLVRQHVKGMPTVAVLGAGKLAREILPWLIGKTTARLFYRNWQHAKDLLPEYPELHLDQYSNDDAGWQQEEIGLVIAAPMKASQVENWVRQQSTTFSKCLDLRGDAATDPISLPIPVIKLSELFDALRAERQRLEGRVDAARAEIKQLVQRQSQQAQFRPFGWEDLCA